ncbi:hypothetical protein [Kribbella deserti]|uniref:Uncharacterized protein n=1 Tax=Kribbella deserti TaxID=1926257 RepID=A0ABV6QEQ5_9ACTN
MGSPEYGWSTGSVVLGVPLAYGLFYANGRALGAVLTGTRLVRLKGALAHGGSGTAPGTTYRASVEVDATNRLRAAESTTHR